MVNANKKMVPILGLLLILAGAIAIGVGARQEPGIRVPPGEIVEAPNARAGGQGQQVSTPLAPALPPTNERVIFQDDFASLKGWSLVDNAEVPANWVSHEGRLEIWGDQNGNPSGEISVLANRNFVMGDGTFEMYVYPTAGEPVGLAFRGSDAGYYRLELYSNRSGTGPKAALYRISGQSDRGAELATTSAYSGYEHSRWQLMSIRAVGSHIVAQVDGQTILEANDSSFTSGWAGVWTITGFGAQFDNARLTSR